MITVTKSCFSTWMPNKYVIFNKCVVLCIKVLFCLVYKANLQVNEALSVLVTYAILITSICTDTSSLVIN